MICRVNSDKDVNYGSNDGTMIEPNYYKVDGKPKRFFTKKQIHYFFNEFEIISSKEAIMTRYDKPKHTWEIVVRAS